MSFDFLANLVLAHGYLVVVVAVALDCAALPIPGELLLLTIGGLAFRGHLDPVSAIAVAVGGVLIADGISYWAGRLGGQRVLARIGLRGRWTPGTASLVFGRFVIGARVVVAPLAGVRRLPYARFLACDALGATLWAAAYVLVGYGAGANLGTLQRHWASAMSVVQIALAAGVVAFAVHKLLRASRIRLAIGAALLALFSLRAATAATDTLPDAEVHCCGASTTARS
jgi:membrane protein DedA with SNARE-associated domain